jgi:hypothetical protein
MKKMNFIFLLFIILLLNFGCTNQSIGNQTQTIVPQGIYGLVITSFSTTRNTIGKGETVTLTIEMLNNGDASASNINTTLLGLGDFSMIDSRLSTNYARVNASVYNIWRIKSPDYKVVNSIQARISYDYLTEGFIDAMFVNESMFRTCTACEYGGKKAPLSVNLSVDNPVVIHEQTNEAPFTLVINLKNTGKGRVVNDNINNITVEVPNGTTIVSHTCNRDWDYLSTGGTSIYTYTFDPSNLFDPCTRLVSADYIRIRLNMNYAKAYDGLVQRIKVKVNYRYQIDSNFLKIEVKE